MIDEKKNNKNYPFLHLRILTIITMIERRYFCFQLKHKFYSSKSGCKFFDNSVRLVGQVDTKLKNASQDSMLSITKMFRYYILLKAKRKTKF